MGVKIIPQDVARQAIYALLDVLDGQRDSDIENMTGLPPARCIKIATLHRQLLADHMQEWLNRK
jgi:hypothetical protein